MATRERTPKTLDNQDRKILAALQKNARLSNAELAEQIGMSTTACWNRTRQLELDGYIDGYVALVNQRMLGYADIVILEVTLDRHEDDALGRFGAELAALPEVLEAYLVSGEYDYWIKVAVDGTAGYERFLREKLYRISSIRHSRSMFALRCMKTCRRFRCDDAGAAGPGVVGPYYGRSGEGGYHRAAEARCARHSNRAQRLPIRGTDGN